MLRYPRHVIYSFQTLVLFLLLLSAPALFAQRGDITVKGKITDENGAGLGGATVSVNGTNRKAVTGDDGSFSISAPSNGSLSFTHVGYEAQQVSINNQESITLSLTPTNTSLTQVLVVGYGTQKRATVTGSVASVNAKTISELPVPSVAQALQGRVAGVSVVNNGSPGTSPIVRIRGISSISFASDPLYVIDGFPTGNLASFDSRDIESVEVLKDASAAAIYGSRATNGVIIITTKKGRRDNALKVTFDSYVGVQNAWKKIDLLNTQQYLQYERALNGAAGIGLPPRLQSASFNLPIYDGVTQTFAQTNTDWQDAYFKQGLLTQHNIGISGGNEVSRFYTSAGYFKQDGIAQGVNYERGNLRLNSEHRISKVFTFGENLYLAFSDQRYDNTGGNRTRLVNVIRNLPYLPVYDPTTNGGFRNAENSVDGADPTNPVEDALLLGNAHRKTLKTLGTAYIQVNFTPWLNFRSVFGVDYTNTAQHQFSPIFSDKGRSATVATINDTRTNFTTLLFTQQLTLDKTFGDHHVNVVGVFERQGTNAYGEIMTGNQATNARQTMTGATNPTIYSTRTDNLLISYVGRLNYEFRGKYLLSGAIRRDGLSVWAPGKKFANFPSGSIGWRVDQEEFLKTVTSISELKIRGGYGVTGLNGAGIFPALSNSALANDYPWQSVVQENGAIYPFNNAVPSAGNASYYNSLANADLEWEKTNQLNIGLDLGLFNNKVTFSADYYQRQTDNLILNVPTPASFGFNATGVLANVGSMRNNGFDLQLGYNQTGGPFTWNLTGNFGIIRNKVLQLNTANAAIEAGADQDFGNGTITRTVAGQPIQSFYGYLVAGIFQTAQEVASSPVQIAGKTAAGDLKFKDISGPNGKPDGIIDANDRTFIGNYLPKFSYALNYTARYKNLDLSVFFQGVQGNKIFNAARIISEGMARLFNSGTAVLRAWTPTNTNTDIPRAISGDPNQNLRVSDRWIEDGSYLRLKNLMVGYNVPVTRLKGLGGGFVSNARIYVSSQNLLTFTKYKGWDPEIGSKNTTLTNGIDYGQYPAAVSFQVGVQVGF
ncbi:MAG: TonB-dependent receptor [Williamsia sp.]|nr:TonB-dependent receptor [Williamsia sp.]